MKQKVSDISVYSFICMSVIMFTCFALYSFKKNEITVEQIKSDLSANLRNQTNQFLPSFLLPEQSEGIQLILSKIQNDESLEDIRVIKDASEVPPNFVNCRPTESRVITCASRNLALTAVVAPLKDMDQTYGFIFKSKRNSSAGNIRGAIQFAAVSLAIIGLAFLAIYFRLRLLISKTLPDAMNQIVHWIEAEIEGKDVQGLNLPFAELEELKIKIAEVIERSNKSRDQAIIGQVTSGIMHDIKTPLQSIVTATHLVQEQDADSPKRLSRLENLYKMCTLSIPSVNDIIETTLDGNRNIQISKAPANIQEALDAAVFLTRDFSKSRNVEVEVESPTQLISNFDPIQLKRVLNNLLKNGIEAASESSAISRAKVKLSVNQVEGALHIIVEDSGPGFTNPPEKVFRAFMTTKTHGTGLGLMISKKIIEAHSGSIKASNGSSLGGARLEVQIPV